MKSSANATNHIDLLGRNFVQIDLTQPFEQVVAAASALPDGRRAVEDEEIVKSARAVYEVVHGRSVQTTVGVISIAPGVCPWLIVRHLKARTREDFLTAAEQWLARVGTERGVIARTDFAPPNSSPNGSDDGTSLKVMIGQSRLTAPKRDAKRALEGIGNYSTTGLSLKAQQSS